MRVSTLAIVTAVIATALLSNSTSAADYMKMSKVEVVQRLGLPAQISLFDSPEPEIWHYYYTHDDGVVLAFSVQFREGRVVSYSYDPMFDPRRILSPDRPADLAKIWSYIHQQRAKLRRAK